MKRVLAKPLKDNQDDLMKSVGYIRHCTEAGRACYHRPLHNDTFPRFHAYVANVDQGLEIDLHFDQFDSLKHKGNHNKAWAYTGPRVNNEIKRIFEELKGESKIGKINQSAARKNTVHTKQPKKKSLFEILFK